jgi:hypothetical protein
MASDKNIAAATRPVVAAVKRLLRPLVRLLIAKGVTLPEMTELLKDVYVSVAVHDVESGGKAPTDSRVSLMTGVHRKDVKRLRGLPPEQVPAPRSIGIGAQVVARWLSAPDMVDAQGRPRPLPRQADQGPSFDALVESVSKDVRPRAVLDEWLRLGVARLDADGRVILNQLAFIPAKGLEEKSFYLGRNVGDHMAAIAHNILAEGNPLLERSVHYSGLTADSVKTLTEAAERTGMQALLALNRMALELADRDAGRADADQRINFGLYFYNGTSSFNHLDQGKAASDDAG